MDTKEFDQIKKIISKKIKDGLAIFYNICFLYSSASWGVDKTK